MYFVGAVIITIKCNNEFYWSVSQYRFWTEKNCLDQTEIFVYQSCIKRLLRIKQSQTNDALMTLVSLNMTSSEQIT